MLRLDPGEDRIHTARTFRVWEGGGEYNVARGLRRCFGLRTAIATALADNPVGRLVEDLMLQGGVDQDLVRWAPYDGVGRKVRNGLNFTERGYGVRAAVGLFRPGKHRGLSSQAGRLRLEVDLRAGSLVPAGSTPEASSPRSPSRRSAVAGESMDAARAAGTLISYDLNYRESLWKSIGGKTRAQEVNRELVRKVDVLFGNEEDFSAMLGFEVEGVSKDFDELPVESYAKMLRELSAAYPNLKVIASTLRTAHTASENAWGAIALHSGGIAHVAQRNVDILDRVGGGDSFASGLIYGILADKGVDWAVKCGVAHGALAMTYARRHQHREPRRGPASHGRRSGAHFQIISPRVSDLLPR